MALTRSFNETIKARVQADRAFREALLREAVQSLLSGDVETGKSVLRDYINATEGFEALGTALGIPSKSLLRMFGPAGNPQANNLFAVISHLQEQADLDLVVTTHPTMRARADASPADT
jgi:DNA-binding phage protein